MKSVKLIISILLGALFGISSAQNIDTVLVENIMAPKQLNEWEELPSQTYDPSIDHDSTGMYLITLKTKSSLKPYSFTVNLYTSEDSLRFTKYYNFEDELTDAKAILTDDGYILVVYGLKESIADRIYGEIIDTSGNVILESKKLYNDYNFTLNQFELREYNSTYFLRFASNQSSSYCEYLIAGFNTHLEMLFNVIHAVYYFPMEQSFFKFELSDQQLRVVYSIYGSVKSKIYNAADGSLISDENLISTDGALADYIIDAFGNNVIIFKETSGFGEKLILKKYNSDFSELIASEQIIENSEYTYGQASLMVRNNTLIILFISHELPGRDSFYWGVIPNEDTPNHEIIPFEMTPDTKSIESFNSFLWQDTIKLIYTDKTSGHYYSFYQTYNISNLTLAVKILMGNKSITNEKNINVAKNEQNEFLVIWTHDDNLSRIYCQMMNEEGEKIGELNEVFATINRVYPAVKYIGDNKFRILWNEFADDETNYYSALYSADEDSILSIIQFNHELSFFNMSFNYIIDINEERHLFLTKTRGDTVAVERYSSATGELQSVHPVNYIDGAITQNFLGLHLVKADSNEYFAIWEGSKTTYDPDVYFRRINGEGIPEGSNGKVLLHFGNPYWFQVLNIHYIGMGQMLFSWQKTGFGNSYTLLNTIVDTLGNSSSEAITLKTFQNCTNPQNSIRLITDEIHYFVIYRNYYEPFEYVMQVFDLDYNVYGDRINYWDTDEVEMGYPNLFVNNDEALLFYVEKNRETNLGKVKLRKDRFTYHLVGVEEELELPHDFKLAQNYPNPFNPSTIIEFYLPERTRVLLEVFNVLGEKIATPVNKVMDEGNHKVRFNAEDGLSSGVYFYRIEAGKFTKTEKMILLR
ncbi:MAG: hypothetical protein SCALA702_06460 [Melioribacteraceae bacterium]|nr:MAG: hypothetical protein SCALA702_06460 [Melioribacteraceae bacterium]